MLASINVLKHLNLIIKILHKDKLSYPFILPDNSMTDIFIVNIKRTYRMVNQI